MLFIAAAEAQAPSNDVCAGAIDLTSMLGNGVGMQQSSDTYSNIGATGEPELADALEGFWFDEDTLGNMVSVDQSVWLPITIEIFGIDIFIFLKTFFQ